MVFCSSAVMPECSSIVIGELGRASLFFDCGAMPLLHRLASAGGFGVNPKTSTFSLPQYFEIVADLPFQIGGRRLARPVLRSRTVSTGFPGFVYKKGRFSSNHRRIEITLRPRKGSGDLLGLTPARRRIRSSRRTKVRVFLSIAPRFCSFGRLRLSQPGHGADRNHRNYQCR